MTAENYLHQVADGRVYSGEQAFQLGLVDELGTLDDAVSALGKELGIEGKPELLEYEPRKGLMDILNSKVNSIIPSMQPGLQYYMMLE
jgi:protease IV